MLLHQMNVALTAPQACVECGAHDALVLDENDALLARMIRIIRERRPLASPDARTQRSAMCPQFTMIRIIGERRPHKRQHCSFRGAGWFFCHSWAFTRLTRKTK